MDHVIGLACGLGGAQHLGQALKGGRAQHVQLKGFAGAPAQSLDEAAGHRAEGHVVVLAGVADDQQDADGADPGLGELWALRGLGLGAHKSLGAQSQRRVGLGVADQLPGDGRGLLHSGDDFDAGLVQAGPQLGPQLTGVVVGVKHGPEKLCPDLGHALLDAGSDGGRRVEWVLQKVFQVPAQVFLVLRAELEIERV